MAFNKCVVFSIFSIGMLTGGFTTINSAHLPRSSMIALGDGYSLQISISPLDTAICPGDSVEFTAIVQDGCNVQWQIWVEDVGFSDIMGATGNMFQTGPVFEKTKFRAVADCDDGTSFNSNAVEIDVSDIVPPVAKCKIDDVSEPILIYLDELGMASITPQEIDDGSSDNCSLDSMAVIPSELDCKDIGAIEIKLNVWDASGNQNDCSTQIQVADTIPPTANCRESSADNPVEVFLNSNGMVDLLPGDIDDGSSDNCGVDSLSVFPSSFSCSDTGPDQVTLVVWDSSGNKSDCSASVLILDTIAPMAVCSYNDIYLNTSGQASLSAEQVGDESQDNCGSPTLSVVPNTFDCSHFGYQQVVLTATDPSGNVDSCFAQVYVEDPHGPTALCKSIIVYLDTNGTASISPAAVDNGSYDNCDSIDMSLSRSSFSCADIGSSISVGLEVTDRQGHDRSCLATVTVEDTISPVALCKDITVYIDENRVSIEPHHIDDGSSDNCFIDRRHVSPPVFYCSDTGDQTVQLYLEDDEGNSSSCSATVTVLDNTPPMTRCRNATVFLDQDGYAQIDPQTVDNNSYDDCFDIDLDLSDSTFDCTMIGEQTVYLTAIDHAGNQGSCQAIVTVLDTLPPVAQCEMLPDETKSIYLDEMGSAVMIPKDIDNGSFDNCSVDSMDATPSTFSCINLGEKDVTLTVWDSSGNFSSCLTYVQVMDTIAPTARCFAGEDGIPLQIALDKSGNSQLSPAMIDDGSFDNCEVDSTAVSPKGFSCDEIGARNVVLIVWDGSGNVDSCSTTVEVLDTTPPIAKCRTSGANDPIEVFLDENGMAAILQDEIDDGSSDNCSIGDKFVNPVSFDCGNLGSNQVILTVVDNSGNRDSCVVDLEVVDTSDVCLINTFVGTNSDDWFDPANWSLNHVPTSGEAVLVPCCQTVTIDGHEVAQAYILELELGAELIVISQLNVVTN